MCWYGPGELRPQWAQAAILSDITEPKRSDKVKMAQKTKGRQEHRDNVPSTITNTHANIVEEAMCQDSPSIWKDMHQMWGR